MFILKSGEEVSGRGFEGLGIIPAWQFSMDPSVNPKINPFVKYPPGTNQSTIQALGATRYQPVQLFGLGGFRGLGSVSDTVSSLGSFAILALAALGGWSLYKKVTRR